MDRTSQLEQLILSGKRAHLVGIGGVSMSPLASVLAKYVPLSGSDIRESTVIEDLRSKGITVHIGHSAGNVTGADFVIRTAAAREDNPEIIYARENGIPVFERAEAWGVIMRNYKNALCISGTHGKTTTTSMATHILMAAHADPTVMIGGTLPLIHAGYRVGGGDTIVLESCEYYDSFLSFFPTVAVVLDIDIIDADVIRGQRLSDPQAVDDLLEFFHAPCTPFPGKPFCPPGPIMLPPLEVPAVAVVLPFSV